MEPSAGARRWLPGLQTLGAYQRSWLPRDLVAGIVLTALLVPAGMGYAEASGLPAIYGLYATIVPLVVYAIVGPSRILVLGPDSSLAPLIAAAVLPLAAGSDAEAVALAGMLAILSGLLRTQERRGLAAYLGKGVRLVRRLHRDAWATLVVEKR